MDTFTPAPSLPERPSPVEPAATSSSASVSTGGPVVAGPTWYRSRIRLFGPVVALILPGLAGALAYASLELSDTAWSGAVGLVAGVLAAPALLAVGAPFSNSDLYPLAVVASLVIWLLVGLLASRRATRNPMASWNDYWRHYLWMLGGIWAGAIAALVIAGQVVGESLW